MQRSIPVDRPRSWTNPCKRHDASNVEQIAFVSRRPELRSSIVDAYQLDRTEAIWQMDRENRYRKQNDGRNTHQRNKGSDQESDASNKLSGDCDPGHKVRPRNTRGIKNAGERFRSPEPFRQTMCEKSITDHQSQGDPRIGLKSRLHIP